MFIWKFLSLRMIRYYGWRHCFLLLLALLPSTPLAAQDLGGSAAQPDTLRDLPHFVRPLLTLGSPSEERIRIEQLLGRVSTAGYLIRSPSTLTPPLGEDDAGVRWAVLSPELRMVRNSGIPYSLNEGALWTGRGTNLQLMGGIRGQYGPVSLILAPQLLYVENQDFEVLPRSLYEQKPGKSIFGSFWHTGDPSSIDLPYRFGDQPLTQLDLGQTTLRVDVGPVAFGLSTENQWWGPGIRNAIVMSNNAPGIPRLFVRTASPLSTPVGEVEAKWMMGGLTESLFFDRQAGNDLRSLSALALTYRPVWEPGLTLGAARAVYANAGSISKVIKQSFDVVANWERRDSIADLEWTPRASQIFSLFGRWVFPDNGFEVYGEWARHEIPSSFRDFLLAPNHTQGYTVGLQWARPFTPGMLRLQGEVTSLEESATFKQRPVDTYYTSRSVPQGYTHRGQVIGAGIGPGSSSQWLALDFLAPRWQAGAFLGRVRWETDALYLSRSPAPWRPWPLPRSFHAYDASLLRGIRAGYRHSRFELGLELTIADRLNFLFQNPDTGWSPEGAVDVRNHTLRLLIIPLPNGL